MNKLSAVLVLLTPLGLVCGTVSAFDNDTERGPVSRWYGSSERSDFRNYSGDRRQEPIYFRPTQRYYGKGYTVSYRYIPVYAGRNYDTLGGSSNFRTEAFRIATIDIPKWGANLPRMTVNDPKGVVQRTAVTSIVKSKRTKTAPASAAPTIIPAESTGAPIPTPDLNVPPSTEAPKP